MGVCLLQEGQTVSFASRSLTDTQQNYVQIEKDLLAIVFGFEKYHNFVYGHKVIFQIDHKPLTAIVKKPISKISNRLQEILITLLNNTYEVKYLPGKDMYIEDTLYPGLQALRQKWLIATTKFL